MTTVAAPATFETMADIWEKVGCVPLHRILMVPTPGTATEADVIAMEGKANKRLCELIDGVLVEKAMGFRESALALALVGLMQPFVRLNNLGILAGEGGMMRILPNNVRIPDVSFVSWDRLPGRRMPTRPVPHLAPNLAVEVLSQGNTVAEMERKRQDYFQAGVELYWEVDPEERIIDVYTSPTQMTRLTVVDTIDGGTVLPGFTLSVQTWFDDMDRHG